MSLVFLTDTQIEELVAERRAELDAVFLAYDVATDPHEMVELDAEILSLREEIREAEEELDERMGWYRQAIEDMLDREIERDMGVAW